MDATPPPGTASLLSPSATPQRTNLTTLERQIQTANAFAILSTLFAGIQAQLLSGIPAEPSPKIPQALINALHFSSYGGLAINISASLAAILFISFANMIPAEWDQTTTQQGDMAEADHVIERLLHQASKLRHDFICLTFLGTYFVLLQISLLAWTAHKSTAVFVLVIAVVWLSFHPFTVYINLFTTLRRRHR